MPSTNSLNELCVETTLLRSIPNKLNGGIECDILPVMQRSDAYSYTNYSRGI